MNKHTSKTPYVPKYLEDCAKNSAPSFKFGGGNQGSNRNLSQQSCHAGHFFYNNTQTSQTGGKCSLCTTRKLSKSTQNTKSQYVKILGCQF